MKCRGGPYARRGGSAYPPASYGLSARQIYLGMQRAAQRPLRADTQIRPYGGNGMAMGADQRLMLDVSPLVGGYADPPLRQTHGRKMIRSRAV